MSRPVITLNSSPAMWGRGPVAGRAILILPRLARAKAMNSWTVSAGIDGLTSMTRGVRMMLATGAMSWMMRVLAASVLGSRTTVYSQSMLL